MSEAQFEVHKAIAAIGYLIEKTGESLYTLLKMMYVADKLHLERTGRFICNDTYAAMAKGPVPSHTYDLLKCVRESGNSKKGADTASRIFAYGPNHKIQLKTAVDYDELSRSDVECLDEVVRLHSTFGWWGIRDMSHDKAWASSWKNHGGSSSIEMDASSIASTLSNTEQVMAHWDDPHPGTA